MKNKISLSLLPAGFKRLNSKIEINTDNQIITIWCITALATASVISGLKLGIRRLSELCFTVGMFILMVVLFYDNTWYILNLYVQSIGYYLQWILQLGFHTDAFAQLGNAPDKKEKSDWIDAWTIFYWGWWIAWSPFVGMFIAKISRGKRTTNPCSLCFWYLQDHLCYTSLLFKSIIKTKADRTEGTSRCLYWLVCMS